MEDPVCDLEMEKIALSLTEQVEAYELTDNFDPSDLWYGQIIAHIRHEYTNYENLLHKLPSCTMYISEGGICGWDFDKKEDGGCPLVEFAHYILKREANSHARNVYDNWLRKRKHLSSL